MAKSRKSLIKPRSIAFSHQKGHCFYCRQPMWSENPLAFAQTYNVSIRQANLLQCTGEHLISHKDGGDSSQNNIVAACKFCNNKRHQRKVPPTPEEYKQLINKRMNQGKWHGMILN